MAFGGLKKFFFEETGESSKNESKQTPAKGTGQTSFTRRLPDLDTSSTSSPITNPIQADTSFVPAVRQTNSGINQQKLMEHFDEVLSAASGNAPGYYSYSHILAEMGEIPDTAKYKGAYAAIKAQGVSKQALISNATQCIAILDNDFASFQNEALQNQKESKDQIQAVNNLVDANNAAISKLQQDTEMQIKQLQEARDIKIRQYQREIDENKKKIAPLEEEAAKMNDRIQSFKQGCDTYKGIIQNDINKIQSLLQ